MGWFLTTTEANRLQYLPYGAIVLYVMILRRHVCFKTGVIGETYRISERALVERLEVHRQRGSTMPEHQPSRQEIRTMLSQLQRSGLVEPIKGRRMCFRLPLAAIGPLRPNEEQPNAQPNAQPEEQPNAQPNENSVTPDKSMVSVVVCIEEQPEEQPDQQPEEQPDEQPTSVVYSDLQLQGGAPDDFSEPFLITASWKPSKAIEANLKMAGIVDYSPLMLTEFVHYWLDPDNNHRLTQHQWENKFLKRLVHSTRTNAMRQNTNARYKAASDQARRKNGTAAQRFEQDRAAAHKSAFDDEFPEAIQGDFKTVTTGSD